MNEFHYTGYAQEITFGAGALARLPAQIEQFGWRRLLLCSGRSLRRDGTIDGIASALGDRLVAVYDAVQSHVHESQVAEVIALAEQHEVEAVIGLGGGGALGVAKAVSFALEEQRGGQPARAFPPAAQALVPVIAIPTTYAGSEMTPVYGITRQVEGQARKITVADPRIAPKVVIYDPLLTLHLPPVVTASTGINALAHCIEALYSNTRNPLSTATALSGISIITRALPRCYADGNDQAARVEMLNGAHLAGVALAHVAMALHHGVCHVLGGTAGVPHGIANSIMLPHAMRFNNDAAAAELAQAAGAMGIATQVGWGDREMADAAAQRVADLVRQMHLPQRLRDVGVAETALPELARLAFQGRTVHNNPQPITDAAQLETLLRAAW
jgi:alcohol dehydrogenase class IV